MLSAAQLFAIQRTRKHRVASGRPTNDSIGYARNGAFLETPAGDTFENAPLVNLVYKQSQEAMRSALRQVGATLGKKYPLVIDGERIWTGEDDQPRLTPAHLNKSSEQSPRQEFRRRNARSWPRAKRPTEWSRTSFRERARITRASCRNHGPPTLRTFRLEVFEVGKPWAEADGDIREAMDFCLFYAHKCG